MCVAIGTCDVALLTLNSGGAVGVVIALLVVIATTYIMWDINGISSMEEEEPHPLSIR